MPSIQILRLAAVTLLLTAGFPLLPAPDFLLPAAAQTVQDRKAEADRLLEQANQRFQSRDPEAALQYSQQALQICQAIKDRTREGNALANIGRAYFSLKNYDKAIEYSTQSLKVVREIKDQPLEGEVLERLGFIYGILKDYPKAVNYLEQTLAIYRALKDQIGERRILGDLGDAYLLFGNYAKAIECQEKSLALILELKDQGVIKDQGEIMEAASQRNGAYTFLAIKGRELSEQGDQQYRVNQYAAALQSRQEALNIYRLIKNRFLEGKVLADLADTYGAIGNYAKANEYREQVLVIARGLENRTFEREVLEKRVKSSIAYTNLTLGNDAQAIKDAEQRLAIAGKTSHQAEKAESLSVLGNIQSGLGNYTKAIEYFNQSLVVADGHQRHKVIVLTYLANAYYHLGNYAKAIEYGEQSLALIRRLEFKPLEYRILNILGDYYRAFGNYTKAIKYAEQSLSIAHALKEREGQVFALSNIGSTLVKQQQPELAIVFYKDGVNVLEGIRKNLRSLPPAEQVSYTQSVADTYRNLASLLLQQNRVMEAMQVLDLLKVQELQDYLKDIKGNALTAQGVPLLPQEQEIVQAFKQNPAISQTATSPAVTALVAQLRQTAAAQNLTLPAYKDLQARIQKLGKNIALFYPLILDDRLELVLFIPDRPPIRKTVNVKRAEFEREIGTFRTLLPDTDLAAVSKIRQSAQQLYTWLVQPIDAELKAAKVQTIVYAPDGQMRYVPLAALHDGSQWLTERYQINYLTALALTPIDAPDTRFRKADLSRETPSAFIGALTQERTITVAGKAYEVSPLDHTQAEVEQIAKTIPNTKPLIDQPFNRKNLLAQMPQAAIVHLATHAKFGGTPEESFIVLGDGDVVTLREIEAWKLPNVSLFVLSACETGLGGKLGNGLEILGFGYQMQRTGSRAAIASLWAVQDDGTSELMSEFYAALQKGNSKAEALRQAQIELINDSKYRHPLYWAPFILIGNGL
jgi:CHAT domain-containing protein